MSKLSFHKISPSLSVRTMGKRKKNKQQNLYASSHGLKEVK